MLEKNTSNSKPNRFFFGGVEISRRGLFFDEFLLPYGSKDPRKGSLPLYDSLPRRRRSSRKSSQLRTCCRALSSWPSFLASVSRPICRVSWLLSAMVFFYRVMIQNLNLLLLYIIIILFHFTDRTDSLGGYTQKLSLRSIAIVSSAGASRAVQSPLAGAA